MNEPLISIIIPVFNAKGSLKACVDSVLNQTYQHIEVIIIDDGSRDGSSFLCDVISSKNGIIRVHHQNNQGVSAARNKGIELSKGDYVTFVDADDWIDPNVCEVLAESLRTIDYDLFCYSAVYHWKKQTRSYLFKGDLEQLSPAQKEELHCKVMTPSAPGFEYNCNTRFAGSVWGKFYKAKILKENRLLFSTKTIISEDVLFNVLTMDFFDKIGYSTKTFYHYQITSTSAQNRYRRNSMEYFGFIIDEIQQWLISSNKNQQYRDCANSLFVHYLFGTLKEDYFHKDNPDQTLALSKVKCVLSQEKYQNILMSAQNGYFSMSEKFLIALMRLKMIFVIRTLMRIYNGIQILVP